jgi:hypothetical protein
LNATPAEALAYAADVPLAKESYVTIDAGISWDHAKYCTPAYITMEAGMSWVDFAKPDLAIEIFRDSLRTWPSGSQVRDRGLCLARLATASAVQHDIEPAYEAAAEALVIARTTGSARIRGQLVSAYNHLKPAGSHPVVQELGHQLAALTAGQNYEPFGIHQHYH